MRDYSQFIHEWETESGSPRFAVGEWMDRQGQYLRVFDATERQATGCWAEFSSGMQSFRTRRQALRRARWLYYEQDREWIDGGHAG